MEWVERDRQVENAMPWRRSDARSARRWVSAFHSGRRVRRGPGSPWRSACGRGRRRTRPAAAPAAAGARVAVRSLGRSRAGSFGAIGALHRAAARYASS